MQNVWCDRGHGPDIAGEVDNARRLVRAGKIGDARNALSTLYKTYAADPGLQISYARFLYSCGEYEYLIKEFGSSPIEIIKEIVDKSRKNMVRESGANEQVLEELVQESPYSRRVMMALAQKLLDKGKYARARRCAEELFAYYGNDVDVRHLYAHASILSGMYARGIAMLRSMERHKDAERLERLIAAYEDTAYSTNKLASLRALLSEISIAELETSEYRPSLYTHIKYNHVLYDCVWQGIEQRARGMTELARKLHKFLNTDNSAYLYVMALIIDEDSSAEEVYRKEGPQSIFLRQALERELENSKARKREEKEQKRGSYTGSEKGDPRGYYKILGVGPDASDAEIKSAFRKKSRENEYKHLKEVDPKEYERREKQQTLLNNAYDCLKNTKSRQKYDEGIDNTSPSAGSTSYYDASGIEDFLRTFFGSGFSGFSGNGFNTHGRSGSRTYYYRYV